ncbi:MAG: hypothetical protein AAF730_19850 [Bacteroidota bacterium]
MTEQKARYTEEQIKAMKARHFAQARPDEEIDTSDIPTPTPEQWANARLVTPPAKKLITIRLDEDSLTGSKRKTGRTKRASTVCSACIWKRSLRTERMTAHSCSLG